MKRYFWQTYLGLAFYGLATALVFGLLLQSDVEPKVSFAILSTFIIVVGFLISLRFVKPFSNELERALNVAAKEMRSRIEITTNQKNQQDAVFASMGEGVLALDGSKKILEMNAAAATILKLDRNSARGRSVAELVRIPEILDLIEDTLVYKIGGERDIEISNGAARFLQVRARPLMSDRHLSSGIVLVLSDVTRLTELEGMRKNFVANVSHELRTPLTSIQGFAETLLNPAVTDANEMKKFIAIIQKHSIRLSQIIEDLLTLSRLERGDEAQAIDKHVGPLKPTLADAVQVCGVKAQAKNIKIVLECPAELNVPMEGRLIEQAVVNLIDNAIRYSEAGKEILVKGFLKGDECFIQVTDNGPGIPEKHLSRLFERFYRVDKARSREQGGTGLGLSIVKHIVLAHKGRVDVQSQVGSGSTFSLIWPVKKPQI